MYTIHLLVNHRFYADPLSPILEFDEYNIRDLNRTIGEMYRDVIKRIVPYIDKKVVDF